MLYNNHLKIVTTENLVDIELQNGSDENLYRVLLINSDGKEEKKKSVQR